MGNCCQNEQSGQTVEAADPETPAYSPPPYTPPEYSAPVVQESFSAQPPLSVIEEEYSQMPLQEPEPLAQAAENPEILAPPAPIQTLQDDQNPEVLAADQNPEVLAPQPVTKEVETPQVEGPSVSLEFAVKGTFKTVVIREAPLGLKFKNEVPLVVRGPPDPNGAGANAGVQESWVLVSVGETSIRGLDYDESMNVLKQGLAPLPKAAKASAEKGFVIGFQTPNGMKQVTFNRKPLDMTFDSKTPVTVKKVTPGGHADVLGIEVGYIFASGNGKDLLNTDFKGFMSCIQEGTKNLPTKS